MRYREVKMTQNRDKGPQVRTYEVVYAENELFFDFYFRFYEDVIRALNGEQVYVPNVHALFDNEVAIISYINRLDIEEDRARLMEKHKVTNITDLLKREIHRASSMNKLLKAMGEQFVEAKSINYETMSYDERIKTKLMEHGIVLQFDSVVSGASVDLYRFMPSIGIKMSRLKGYVADIEQVLGASGVRILAPIPDSTLVGFEVPRSERTFPKVPNGDGFNIAIGQDLMNNPRRFDIRTAPHLLVAGATGSGKSVFLDALIQQLSRIPNAELHLFDPKRVELSRHKKKAVEYASDRKKIVDALNRLVLLMEERYKQLEKKRARSIEEVPGMPYKFVVIDEFSDLMLTSKERRSFEELVLRLSQMARAAGIHIVLTTQRPSIDVISGTIRNNFPTKVVFRMGKATDSMVVMDEAGAERLLGKGDMLFVSDKGVERLQGYLA
jgi:S-DNA-T family DNA segregation ATPase FtsK/SpoIIIE